MTYTRALIKVSISAYDEIKAILERAGYHHAIDRVSGVIDMHGLALVSDPDKSPANAED